MTWDQEHFHFKAQTMSDTQQPSLAAGWKGALSSTPAPQDSGLVPWHRDPPPLLTKSIATHRMLMWGPLTPHPPACLHSLGAPEGPGRGVLWWLLRDAQPQPDSVGTWHIHTSASSQVAGLEPRGHQCHRRKMLDLF